MMTQTHMIMGAAIFGRRSTLYAWAGIAGGLLPDLPMYLTVATLKFYFHIPEALIFGVAYFHPYWQLANGLAHSLIFWPLIALASWFLRPAEENRTRTILTFIAILAASVTVHAIIDFLCHREDAHSHFIPLTWWKFMSPVSYWNSNHYGNYFQVFEATLGVIMAITLFRTYRSLIVRATMGLAAILYVAVPAYFSLSH
jgi:hypothetical protein